MDLQEFARQVELPPQELKAFILQEAAQFKLTWEERAFLVSYDRVPVLRVWDAKAYDWKLLKPSFREQLEVARRSRRPATAEETRCYEEALAKAARDAEVRAAEKRRKEVEKRAQVERLSEDYDAAVIELRSRARAVQQAQAEVASAQKKVNDLLASLRAVSAEVSADKQRPATTRSFTFDF